MSMDAAVDQVDPREVLALLLVEGLGQTLIRRGLEAFGSADEMLGASAERLSTLRGLSPAKAERVAAALSRPDVMTAADRELEQAEASGTRMLVLGHPDYPKLLSLIPDPPVLLWVRGELEPQDAVSLGIVGSRKASSYGLEQATRFAAEGAAAGLTIVSGGARGIDGAAHRAVLRQREIGGGGRTLAVIGSGLDRPYPAEHRGLFRGIVASGAGAVLSEHPLEVGPRAGHFPARNRIISGLSLGTLVVEAAVRSGALITARLAVEDHGRECLALPGRVDAPMSAGCNDLIRRGGATLVTSVREVLDQFGEPGRALLGAVHAPAVPLAPASASAPSSASAHAPVSEPIAVAKPKPELEGDASRIWDALTTPLEVDALIATTGLPAATVQSQLTLLEMRKHVRRDGRCFRRD